MLRPLFLLSLASLLLAAAAPAQNGVVINEFVARNNNGIQDEAGQFEDWIELHNTTAAPVDLSGLFMSDDPALPAKWMIPAGTMINPGDFLLIWADEDPLDGPMHASFKLAAAGESILLVDLDGVTVLDSVVFGLQQADVATGNLFDGAGPWVSLLDPTPMAPAEGPGGVRRYDALDQLQHSGRAALSGTPSPGQTVILDLSGFPPSLALTIAVGSAAAYIDVVPGVATQLVTTDLFLLPVTTDALGQATMPFAIPPRAGLIGLAVYAQAGALGAVPLASNALEIVIQP